MKLSAAAAGLLGLVLLLRGWKRGSGAWRAAAVAGLIAAGSAVLGWYAYARWLSTTHGQWEFLQALKLPQNLDDVTRPLWKVLVQWLPEFFVSYAHFVLVIIGVIALVRARNRVTRALRLPLAAYGAGIAIFMAAFLSVLDMHDYFMAPIVPFLVLLAVLGARALYRASSVRAWPGALLVVLLVLVPAAEVIAASPDSSVMSRIRICFTCNGARRVHAARRPHRRRRRLLTEHLPVLRTPEGQEPGGECRSGHAAGTDGSGGSVARVRLARVRAKGRRAPRLEPVADIGKFRVFRLLARNPADDPD